MKSPRRKPIRQMALPLLVGGAALMAALDIGRRIYRNTQLFCPSPDPVKSWNPADYGIPDGAVEQHWFETPDGELLYGWYCRAPKAIASSLFCHGNTGNLTTSADVIPHLLNAGINVLFFDYRGFGKSTGRASVGGIVADGLTAAKFHNKIRPKAVPSILYGYSLGGSVAAQVIGQYPFDGLILQSTFTSLPAITRILYPRLPVHLLAGKYFDTLSVIKRLQVPLLILHGSNDETVPCRMAHELFDVCNSPKHVEIVEGGLHKDLYLRDCDALVWAVNRFATSLSTRTREIALEIEPGLADVFNAPIRSIRRALRAVIPSAARDLGVRR
jgi:fermentation-respiration switch protein FrsA (DUF1100 family)